jgi:hypothetical protein
MDSVRLHLIASEKAARRATLYRPIGYRIAKNPPEPGGRGPSMMTIVACYCVPDATHGVCDKLTIKTEIRRKSSYARPFRLATPCCMLDARTTIIYFVSGGGTGRPKCMNASHDARRPRPGTTTSDVRTVERPIRIGCVDGCVPRSTHTQDETGENTCHNRRRILMASLTDSSTPNRNTGRTDAGRSFNGALSLRLHDYESDNNYNDISQQPTRVSDQT